MKAITLYQITIDGQAIPGLYDNFKDVLKDMVIIGKIYPDCFLLNYLEVTI